MKVADYLSGKPFDKGKILSFEEAVKTKLRAIAEDLLPNQSTSLFEQFENKGNVKLPVNIISGSCLGELPKLKSNSFDFIVSSQAVSLFRAFVQQQDTDVMSSKLNRIFASFSCLVYGYSRDSIYRIKETL